MRDYSKVIENIFDLGYKADFKEVEKYGEKKEAIIVNFEDCNLSPTIYIDERLAEMDDTDLAHEIVEIALSNKPKEDLNVDFLNSWDEVKDKIQYCVCHESAIRTDMVYRYEASDVIGYVRIFVPNINGTIVVTQTMFKTWDITKEELFKTAQDNMDPYEIRKMFGLMNIVTNSQNLYAAANIFKQGVVSAVAEELGFDKMYILPSSVHEVIIIEDTEEEDIVDNLRSMVHDVNESEVAPADLLSYGLFHYDVADPYLKEV